jgi:hypothetical protein
MVGDFIHGPIIGSDPYIFSLMPLRSSSQFTG